MIFASDYGEAGAINELGRGTGLPRAVGGQNTDWWWGPGDPQATTVVVIAPGGGRASSELALLRDSCADVREAATLSNPYGIDTIEAGGHVYVCTGLRGSWADLWPRLRRYA